MIQASTRDYGLRSLRLYGTVLALITSLLFILFLMMTRVPSYSISTTTNVTQTSSTSSTSSSIIITYDLPTAAVATFVLVLLGLVAGLLLMARITFPDHAAPG
ncbi:MAG: hypothetical protein OK439_02440 [Thaumarchaeota archaeon]|nr:hypothetical protein [Nitrososphaerota archaeon]